MNKILILFSLLSFQSYGQNKHINYQAVIRETDNLALANKSISIRISVSADTQFLNSSYIEIHNTKTNINGLFNISIGAGIPIKKTFDTISELCGSPYLVTCGLGISLITHTLFFSVIMFLTFVSLYPISLFFNKTLISVVSVPFWL